MVSLSDVARKAGVSIATASLALRGRGQVAAQTAERVRAMAAELGYRPNPLLASLATRRFRSFGSVEGTPLAVFEFVEQPDGKPGSAMGHYTADIQPHARNLGYAPTVYKITAATATAPLFRELHHRMVQGIILLGSMDRGKFGQSMPWDQFSVVACARYLSALPFHTVRPNIFQGIKLAFGKLRDLGYRRIGFALGQHETPFEDDESRHGAAIALENRYLPVKDRIPPFSGSFDDSQGLLKWVDRHRPDAVVGFSPGHYWQLHDAGHKIPGQLGFACLHLGVKKDSEKMSGLQQNRDEIARQAALQLDQLIRNRERGLPRLPLHILVPSDWVDGGTLCRMA